MITRVRGHRVFYHPSEPIVLLVLLGSNRLYKMLFNTLLSTSQSLGKRIYPSPNPHRLRPERNQKSCYPKPLI